MPRLVTASTTPKAALPTAPYIDFWGVENLKRWPAEVLDSIAMHASSRQFLRDVGLPTNTSYLGGYMKWSDTLPPLPYTRCVRVLATVHDEPVFLLDEKGGDTVIRLSRGYDASGRRAHDTTERFANSSVQRFAECLTAYETANDLLYDDPDYQRKVTKLWRRLKAIDRNAIAKPDSMWSSWIFDARIMC